jgi:transposase
MTKRTRRNHTPAFKAKVALAAISPKRLRFGWGEKTLGELGHRFDLHPNQIAQ